LAAHEPRAELAIACVLPLFARVVLAVSRAGCRSPAVDRLYYSTLAKERIEM